MRRSARLLNFTSQPCACVIHYITLVSVYLYMIILLQYCIIGFSSLLMKNYYVLGCDFIQSHVHNNATNSTYM